MISVSIQNHTVVNHVIECWGYIFCRESSALVVERLTTNQQNQVLTILGPCGVIEQDIWAASWENQQSA